MNSKYSKYLLLLALLVATMLPGHAKREVSFLSEDGLTITADLYFKGNEFPYLILFHQDGSSRGEFMETAERFTELNYNCLAVDLRYGGSINYVDNQTAISAKNKGYESDYLESEKDVKAAIDYAYKKSGMPVVLLGSYFSASLCLKNAINNGRVAALVTFEPGEYLRPAYSLEEHLPYFDKPVFVASSKQSAVHIKKMFEKTPPKLVTFFTPAGSKGEKGAKALWLKSENNKEYWLALLMFFSKL